MPPPCFALLRPASPCFALLCLRIATPIRSRTRRSWPDYVRVTVQDKEFHPRFGMYYEDFTVLANLLRPKLEVDQLTEAGHDGPIPIEFQVAMALIYANGGSIDPVMDVPNIELGTAHELLRRVWKALNECRELDRARRVGHDVVDYDMMGFDVMSYDVMGYDVMGDDVMGGAAVAGSKETDSTHDDDKNIISKKKTVRAMAKLAILFEEEPPLEPSLRPAPASLVSGGNKASRTSYCQKSRERADKNGGAGANTVVGNDANNIGAEGDYDNKDAVRKFNFGEGNSDGRKRSKSSSNFVGGPGVRATAGLSSSLDTNTAIPRKRSAQEAIDEHIVSAIERVSAVVCSEAGSGGGTWATEIKDPGEMIVERIIYWNKLLLQVGENGGGRGDNDDDFRKFIQTKIAKANSELRSLSDSGNTP